MQRTAALVEPLPSLPPVCDWWYSFYLYICAASCKLAVASVHAASAKETQRIAAKKTIAFATASLRLVTSNPFLYLVIMSRNYKFHNKTAAYFVSFATVYWVGVFTREVYFEVLAKSVDYCRQNKGLELYAYCFMPNHVHFIFRSANDDPSGILRDFKKHTSKKTIEAIETNPQESRKEWLLWMFERAGRKKSNVSKYQFWQHHNNPIELWSPKVIKQKLDYIHANPVVCGFVAKPTEWKYSSARNFEGDNTILKLDDMGFMGLDG